MRLTLMLKHLRIQVWCDTFEDGEYDVALTTPSQLQKNLGTWDFMWFPLLLSISPCWFLEVSDGGAVS
jgi:hypothetical protein